MINIDKDQCTGCGYCKKICHHHCIEMQELTGVKIPVIDDRFCSTCCQCVACCPKQALTWNEDSPVPFNDQRLPSAEQMDELLKQRRTTRFFRNRRIERSTLEEVLSYGGYAPTNNYQLRAVTVDNPAMMHELDELQMSSLKRYYNWIFRFKSIFIILQKISPLVNPILKKKFENGLEQGTCFETLPSALIFIIGDHRILLSEASAQYAAYNMMLYAQTKKLGTRFMAAGLTTLNRMPQVRNLLGLTRHEHILSAFELGHPAVHFFNKVEGKDMQVEFAGEENHGGK